MSQILKVTCLGIPLVLAFMTVCVAQGSWHTSKVSVPDDLVVRQIMSRASDALDQGDLDRALRTWQEAIDRMSSKVISVASGRRLGDETDQVVRGDVFGSVRVLLMDRIRTLEDNGLSRYVQLMEPRAADLLRTALAQSKIELLREIHVRYFLTPSGKLAALAKIDLMLEAGRFAEAQFHASALRLALMNLDADSDLLSKAIAREGQAAWALHDHDALKALINEPTVVAVRTKIAGDEIPLSAFLENLLDSLPPAAATTVVIPDPKIFRVRNWSESLKRSRDQGESMTFDRRMRRQMVEYFPVVPTTSNGAVYWCDGSALRCQSLYTGADLWPPVQSSTPQTDSRLNRNLFFHTVVDRDLVFASLRSKPALDGQRAWQGYQPMETIPSHKLVAVDAGTGVVIWNHDTTASRDPESAKFIARLNINQPPLIIGDTLYASGTVLNGVFYHWICAFERATGDLIWKTYVCSGQQELNMFGNPVKENVPGQIAAQEGTLYYSTNIGVFAAVDAANGTIRWLSAYEQEPIPSTENVVTSERHPGWMPSPPAITNDRVYFAPTDSLEFYYADRKTGTLRSVAAATRTLATKNSHFLGLHDNLLLFSGERITALKADDLSLAWTTVNVASAQNSSGYAAIQGRPAVFGDHVWYTTPLSDGRSVLRTAHLKSGAARQEVITDQAVDQVGNVVVSSEAIIVASQYHISAHFDPKRLMADLTLAIRQNPNDPDLLLKLADLEQRQGDWSSAFGNFEKALSIAGKQGTLGREAERRASLALYNGWMRMAREPGRSLRTGPRSVEDRYLKAMEYASTPTQRVRTLMECLEGLAEQGDQAGFTRTANRIISEHGNEWVEFRGSLQALVPEYPPGLVLPAGLVARLTLGIRYEQNNKLSDALTQFHEAQVTWPEVPLWKDTTWREMGRRINGLIAKGGRQVYQSLEREARARLNDARTNKDLEGVRAILLRYPQSSIVEEAYIELSKGLMERGDHAAALTEILASFPRFGFASAASLTQCIETLELLKCYDSAREVAESLLARFPTARIEVEGGSHTVTEWVSSLLAKEPFQSRLRVNPAAALEGGLRPAWTLASEAGEPPKLIEAKGFRAGVSADMAFFHDGHDLIALSAETGKPVWKILCNRSPRMRFHDDRLFADIDDQVVCIEPATGKELWRAQPINGLLRDLSCGHGKVYLLQSTLDQGRSLELVSLDVVSGRMIHRSAIPGFMEGELTTSPLFVAMSSGREGRAVILDSATTQILGSPIAFTDRMQPFLTEKNQLILMTGGTRGSDLVKLQGMDPATGQAIWTQQVGMGTPRMLYSDPQHVVVQVRPNPGRNRDEQIISMVNVHQGKTVASMPLPLNEFAFQATIANELLYVLSMNTTRSNNGLPQRVHAYDTTNHRRLWSTVEFSGDQVEMALVPTKDSLWIHKMILGRSRDLKAGLDELYRVDRSSGRVVDLVDLAGQAPDRETLPVTVRGGTLILVSESGIRGFRP